MLKEHLDIAPSILQHMCTISKWSYDLEDKGKRITRVKDMT